MLKRCSSVKVVYANGTAKSFVCSVFLCTTDNEVKSCVDTSDGSSEFCYLGDMLSVDGDAEAAVTARIRSGWLKFRSLASFLTAKNFSFLLRGKVYDACVWSCMLHGSEMWSLKREGTGIASDRDEND